MNLRPLPQCRPQNRSIFLLRCLRARKLSRCRPLHELCRLRAESLSCRCLSTSTRRPHSRRWLFRSSRLFQKSRRRPHCRQSKLCRRRRAVPKLSPSPRMTVRLPTWHPKNRPWLSRLHSIPLRRLHSRHLTRLPNCRRRRVKNFAR